MAIAETMKLNHPAIHFREAIVGGLKAGRTDKRVIIRRSDGSCEPDIVIITPEHGDKIKTWIGASLHPNFTPQMGETTVRIQAEFAPWGGPAWSIDRTIDLADPDSMEQLRAVYAECGVKFQIG